MTDEEESRSYIRQWRGRIMVIYDSDGEESAETAYPSRAHVLFLMGSILLIISSYCAMMCWIVLSCFWFLCFSNVYFQTKHDTFMWVMIHHYFVLLSLRPVSWVPNVYWILLFCFWFLYFSNIYFQTEHVTCMWVMIHHYFVLLSLSPVSFVPSVYLIVHSWFIWFLYFSNVYFQTEHDTFVRVVIYHYSVLLSLSPVSCVSSVYLIVHSWFFNISLFLQRLFSNGTWYICVSDDPSLLCATEP